MDIAIIPRGFIERFVGAPDRRIHWNVLLSHIVLLTLGLWITQLPRLLTQLPHLCLFQAILGIPCPGCGVTRSALAFITGDLRLAFAENPAGPAVVVAVLCQIPLRVLALARGNWGSTAVMISRTLTVAVLAALIVVWLFRIAQ
jgi:hypothetical protein